MAITELDLEKKKSELQRQENFRNLFVIIAIAAILGVAFIYNRSQIKQKANRDLKLKNDELAATLKMLEQTQDQLVHSQKMASLGELTAGIAHEIQNPLNFVTNFSTTAIDLINDINNEKDAAEKQSLETDLIQVIEKINHHSKRADKIVKNMLLHARVGTEEKELVIIPNLIDEIVDLAYHGIQNKIPSFNCEIVKEYDTNLPSLLINRQEIGRVFLNLIGNSFYAINKRKNNELDSSYTPLLKVNTASINNKVLITISDNGIGIPAETLNKVFEPFYTTKPAGEGTGLGLSISYDIITLGHQGKITVESELNKLTSFKIELPLS
jgi:signal transduction histidine kinase